MWQAEADTELTLSALPATAVGQILFEYCTSFLFKNICKEEKPAKTGKTYAYALLISKFILYYCSWTNNEADDLVVLYGFFPLFCSSDSYLGYK